MIAATAAVQRPPHAKLLVVNSDGTISLRLRSSFASLLRADDLLVANDAATLPASLSGTHDPTGRVIEVRLAGHAAHVGRVRTALRRVYKPDPPYGTDPASPRHQFIAVVFGDGDFHLRTEERPAPPPLRAGDRLTLGPLRGTVLRLLDHPRLVLLGIDGSAADLWLGLARHGKPIQYSHLSEPLRLWDTWTAIAAAPAAFEPPSAGFILSWEMLRDLRARGARLATLTHAAGISSTGDPALDARLPFDEPYAIPFRTAALVDDTRRRGGRVIALGTTVVRALEHAATADGSVRAGAGIATERIGSATRLSVVDAVVTGAHENGTSHHELLRAFVDDEVLGRVDAELDAQEYRTHEFGDSIFIARTGLTAWLTPYAGPKP